MTDDRLDSGPSLQPPDISCWVGVPTSPLFPPPLPVMSFWPVGPLSALHWLPGFDVYRYSVCGLRFRHG